MFQLFGQPTSVLINVKQFPINFIAVVFTIHSLMHLLVPGAEGQRTIPVVKMAFQTKCDPKRNEAIELKPVK